MFYVISYPAGSVIEKLPIICHFMQAKPRYSFIWDVNMVISYNDSLPINKYLSLKELSAKLVVLTALCNAHGSSDLITLNLNFRR